MTQTDREKALRDALTDLSIGGNIGRDTCRKRISRLGMKYERAGSLYAGRSVLLKSEA